MIDHCLCKYIQLLCVHKLFAEVANFAPTNRVIDHRENLMLIVPRVFQVVSLEGILVLVVLIIVTQMIHYRKKQMIKYINEKKSQLH